VIDTLSVADSANDFLTVDPSDTMTGTATAVVKLLDAGGKYSTREVTIKVVDPAPPYFKNLPALFTTEEDTPITIDFSAYEDDIKDIQVLHQPENVDWTLSPEDNTIFSIETVNIDADTFKFNTAANQFGSKKVTAILTDSDGLTAEATFTFEVISVNDPPVISPQVPNITFDEDHNYTIDLGNYETDVDPYDTDDNLKWTLSTYDTSICTMEI
jgi:hypothetical protein